MNARDFDSEKENLLNEIKKVLDEVEQLCAKPDNGGDTAALYGRLDEAKQNLRRLENRAEQSLRRRAEQADQFITEKPYQAAGLAAVAGLLAGLWLNRR